MKEFFKNLGTGLIFFIVSCVSSCFCLVAYYGLTAVSRVSGWEAIGLCFVAVVMLFMFGNIIYCMGVIHNDTIDRLKRKIAELEEEDTE